VLRDSDVLNDWLGWSSWLSRGLDHLWTHEFVFKDLLGLGHSNASDLDEFLEADKGNDEE
jgi:hypothetical protein